MYVVAAFTHDGQAFGSVKVADRETAEREAQRYMDNPRIGRVAVRKVLPTMAVGNGRYR
jgi:hypothetical protein